jgi:hypothetical protein
MDFFGRNEISAGGHENIFVVLYKTEEDENIG